MARRIQGLFLPLLLAVSCLLLFQVSECSRPPSPSPSPPPPPDHALHHQPLMLDAEARTARPPTCSKEVAGDGRTGAAAAAAVPSSAPATPPARAVGAVVASSPPRQTSDEALLVRAGAMPLRSKLARRFLAGAGVDVDGVSCGSFNPHARCPPAGKP